MKTLKRTGLFLITGFILFLVACGGNTPTIEPTITASELTITSIAIASGLRVGDAAPDFTLPDGNGNMVRLSDELKDHKIVALVFYHPDT